MSDPEVNAPVIETPPVETPPDPRIAEAERKAQEAEQRAQQAAAQAATATQLNERYMAELGAARAAQPPQPAADEIDRALSAYQPQDRDALKAAFSAAINRAVAEAEKRAERVGYRMLTQASHQQQLQDPEMLQEAQKALQILNQNPLWANVADELKHDRAIAEARATLAAKKAAAPAPGPGNLPGTSPPRPQVAVPDKEKFIKEFMAKPENQDLFRSMYRGKYTLDSPEGQKAFREAAEIDYAESQKPVGYFSPASRVGRAAQHILRSAGDIQ